MTDMTARHTPGPWVCMDMRRNRTIGSRVTTADGGEIIAEVYHRDNGPIIAAAPETAAERDRLRAALEPLVNAAEAGIASGSVFWTAVDTAKAALANTSPAPVADVNKELLNALREQIEPRAKGWKVTDWALRDENARAAIAKAEKAGG